MMPSIMPGKNRYQQMSDRQRKKHLAYSKVYRQESTSARNIAKILVSYFTEIEGSLPQEDIDRVVARMNEKEMRLFQKWALLSQVSMDV